MLPIIKLSQAWLEELGWSHAEAADVFDMDLAVQTRPALRISVRNAAGFPPSTASRCSFLIRRRPLPRR